MTLRVGVIGCGLIGGRRARSAASHPGSALVAVTDADPGRAAGLAAELGCAQVENWPSLLARSDLDAVAVATFNKHLAPIAIAALESGRHVLVEKPFGRNGAEAEAMAGAAGRTSKVLKVGFNLRFHPAISALHDHCSIGTLGEIFYARAVYGHGGRPGYDQEWRADPDLAGGGELLDQGVHLLDLATWLVDDLEVQAAALGRWFWRLGPLEDNAFVLLRSPGGQAVSLHTSWTMWRNRFEFEVGGSEGFARVSGLGGSYGTESLVIGRRRPEGGPPEESTTQFTLDDTSWAADWNDFVAACAGEHPPAAGPEQGLRVMRLVDAIYEAGSEAGKR